MRSHSSKIGKIRAVTLSLLVIGSVLAVTIGFTGTGLAASNDPRVGIEAPSDDGTLTTQPIISGSATDSSGISAVDIKIENSNGDTWDGSSFTSTETWVNAASPGGTTTVDWRYDAYSNGITADDEYTVTARANASAGSSQTKAFDELNPDPTTVTYEVDTQAPSLSSVGVTEESADDTVSDGDTVKVTATVTDAQSGVASVTADAAVLGGASDLTLTDGNGDDTYDATFDVTDPQTGEGDISLTVTAVDNFGQSRTASDEVTLETRGSDATGISVDHDFVGIVEDPSMLTITASGVVDSQGYEVTDGKADVTVGTKTYEVTVVDGEIDDTIDPTAIDNTTDTGVVDVSLGTATTTVRLMHEVSGLDKGYQVGGTPMPADNVVVSDGVDDVTAYNPADKSWGEADELRGGEGYYIDAGTSEARIGYTFDEDAEKKSDSKLLEKGYNLVGASPNMNNNDKTDVTDDLGADLAVDTDADVTARLPDPNTDIADKKGLDAFNDSSSGTADAKAYQAYWVKIDSTDDYVRTTVEVAYDPSDQ
jgi:hypothetical protein